jgi:Flp pilus assembly protein TadD
MGDRFGRSNDPRTTYLVARACALAPKAVADGKLPTQWAEKALQSNPKAPWCLHTRALAHYRAGQFEQALRRVEEGMAVAPQWPAPVNGLLLAMAHARLGHAEAARHWLEKATQVLGAQPLQEEWHLHDWLAYQLLRREAEALLK